MSSCSAGRPIAMLLVDAPGSCWTRWLAFDDDRTAPPLVSTPSADAATATVTRGAATTRISSRCNLPLSVPSVNSKLTLVLSATVSAELFAAAVCADASPSPPSRRPRRSSRLSSSPLSSVANEYIRRRPSAPPDLLLTAGNDDETAANVPASEKVGVRVPLPLSSTSSIPHPAPPSAVVRRVSPPSLKYPTSSTSTVGAIASATPPPKYLTSPTSTVGATASAAIRTGAAAAALTAATAAATAASLLSAAADLSCPAARPPKTVVEGDISNLLLSVSLSLL